MADGYQAAFRDGTLAYRAGDYENPFEDDRQATAWVNGWRFEMDVQNERIVFVFGSNLAGRHGKGAALSAARFHGAIRGQGVGFMGSCYAIPTKGYQLEVLPLDEIEKHVHRFLVFATMNQKLKFRLTPIGCGLAGYRPDQIAPMFKGAPSNIIMPAEFKT